MEKEFLGNLIHIHIAEQTKEVEESIFAAFRAVVGHDQHIAGEVRITLPQAMVSLMTPHLVAFSEEHEHVHVILLPDDGLLAKYGYCLSGDLTTFGKCGGTQSSRHSLV